MKKSVAWSVALVVLAGAAVFVLAQRSYPNLPHAPVVSESDRVGRFERELRLARRGAQSVPPA